MRVALIQMTVTADKVENINPASKKLREAAANGADIISMSFGGYNDSKAEREALAKAYSKAVLVAAAGNDNLCIYPHPCPINRVFGKTMFPGAYNFVLGVEASKNAEGKIADFSKLR